MSETSDAQPTSTPETASRAPRPEAAPTAPSGHYLAELERQTAENMAAAASITSDFAGADPALHDRVGEAVRERQGLLVDLSHRIHELAETAFEETESAAAIASVISAAGIEVETGVGGVQTALRARIGSGAGRTIGIMAEYDALPGIGHACGHNVNGATAVGAFLALAALAADAPEAVPGTVVFLGTPAEEGHSGKEVMARGGAFEDLDAAIMLHGYGYDCAEQVWLGRRLLDVVFHGRAAHASAQPFMGRNALDAANLMYQGIGLLRQQMPPIDRIHAVLPDGGSRASVITERAELQLYVRSKFPETLKDLSARVEDIARGAALMTGTGVEINWDRHAPSLPVRTNRALVARWAVHQQSCGRDPVPAGVLDESIAASTDFGNISYRMPGIHPLLRISAPEVALHTRDFATAARTEFADRGVVDGSYGLACTALDYLCDDGLAEAVQAEFEAAGGAVDVPNFFT